MLEVAGRAADIAHIALPFLGMNYMNANVAIVRGAAERAGRPAAELERIVRALHPHIGARVELPGGELLGVHRAALAPDVDLEPGLHTRAGRLLLGASPGALELLEVQPPGGRAMDAGSYLRGHPALGRA